MAIGALTRHHDVAESEVLQELCPIVAYAASEIGDPQVRHVGHDWRVGGARGPGVGPAHGPARAGGR